jgi:PAS domain S-box-containing protein
MKISFKKKIVIGFIINLLVVFASGWIYISLLNRQGGQPLDSRLEWIGLSLFVISVVLLTIVYFIIRAQIQAKNVSEELLSENKKLLQSIIDNTTNPIFIKKLNGEYILVNKQYGDLFQISNYKIIGKTDHDFLPKSTADTFRSSDLEAIKAQKEVKVEETIQQADGSHTYIAVKFPLYDATGRVYAVGGISTDITERKKVETSMEVGEKFFNMSLDIMVIASKDKFLKINPTMSKILGYSQEELLNQSFFKYIYKNDIESTKKEIEKLGLGLQTNSVLNK